MRSQLVSFMLMVAVAWPAASRAAPPAVFQAWVPPGWKLFQHVQGDLDGDDRDDAVLVLERTNPANRRSYDGFGTSSKLNLNPRRLLVLFGNPAGWRKGMQIDGFLPSEHDADEPCLADPLAEGGMAIRRGVLTIDLGYWYSCGTWAVTRRSFSFRLEQARFRLIGLDITSFLRNTGEEAAFSANYLTGRTKTTEAPQIPDADGERKPRTTWGRLEGPRTFYLDRMSSRCSAKNAMAEWCR